MLPDPFNADKVVPSGAAVQQPFTQVSLSGGASVRKDLTSDDGGPKVMKLSHNTVGKGDSIRDRHLVRLEAYVVEDSVEDQSKPIALYAVADIPRNGVTASQLSALWKQFTGLFLGGSGEVAYDGDQTVFFDKWVSGQS